MDDHALAADVARRAGDLLLAIREECQADGFDEATTRARGDSESNELIIAALRDARPLDAILSEESKDDHMRLASLRTWIVDPLDGTREFAELGRDDWAVHVALVEAGTPTAAAVALPAQGIVLSTANPPEPRHEAPARPRLVVSRSRPPALAQYLADELGADLVPMGSAGAKTMAIVQGHADIYAHGGGQYEWDSCAPVGVAQAARLHTSRLDGSPLLYNNADPYLPDLLVCLPSLAEIVLAVVRSAPHST